MTFVDWRDMHRWKLISDGLGLGQPEPAETYSTSEHLFTDLSIPPGVTGTLPRELRGARAGLAAEVEEDLGETGKTRSKSRAAPAAQPLEEQEVGRRRALRARRRRQRGHRDGKAADDAAAAAAPRARAGVAPAAAASWAMRRPQSPDMSTPTSLELPEGTRRATVETARGSFAALDAMPAAGPASSAPPCSSPATPGARKTSSRSSVSSPPRAAGSSRSTCAASTRRDGADDPAGYDLAELGADVTAVAEATEASHLLGHSFGGLVARAAVLGGYTPCLADPAQLRARRRCRALAPKNCTAC